MKRQLLLLALVAVALPLHPQGTSPAATDAIRAATADLQPGWLVSPRESIAFEGREGFDGPPLLSARDLSPTIEVIEPHLDHKLKTPFPIEVRFRPRDDAPIVPSTFKVLYGALNIDITSRITKYAHVTPEGLTFDKAQVPPGKHRLLLEVEDAKQRLAERELRFEVE